MISLAKKYDEAAVRQMWNTCFNDSQEFIELYFTEKYKAENSLIFFEGDKAVASLQILPYQFSFYGREIPTAYISGACTLPEYRNRGYMKKLLLYSFELMQERNIPLSLLIPAEDRLFTYYRSLGYEKVFEKNKQIIALKEIVEETKGNIDLAYEKFDAMFRKKDFCVQKTKSDFITILKTAEMDGFPIQTDLSGMARIINAEKLLSIFAEENPQKSVSLHLEDTQIKNNNALYKLSSSHVFKEKTPCFSDEIMSINTLTCCLLGENREAVPNKYRQDFLPHKTTMNLMLE